MNKILFITRHNPYVRSGGGLASKAFIKAFAKLYSNNLDLIIADNCIVDESIHVSKIYKAKQRNLFQRVISIITGQLHRFGSLVKKVVIENNYDICVLDGSIIAGDLVKWLNKRGIFTITIHHNFEPDYHKDNKSIESFKGHFLYHVRNNERKAYIHSKLNLFLTEYDHNKFKEVYGNCIGNSSVIGMFESENQVIENNVKVSKFPSIVISGAMNSTQTIIGIKNFYTNYWHNTEKVLNDFKLTLTGRNPDDEIYKQIQKNSNVTIKPNPIDIYEIISNNNIYCCPTCVGGGIKLRVMDGLKLGLFILVHKISARGYDAFFEYPWFQVYHDQESYMNALQTIKKQLVNHNPKDIQQKYYSYFSFEAGMNRLDNILRRMDLIN